MIIAGIVAGGTGSRMGNTSVPKQFFNLCGKPVIIYTIEKFINHPEIDSVIIGVNPDYKGYMEELKEKYFPDNERLIISAGGKDRNDTILNIISASRSKLNICDDDILLTHDAVRPFVSEDMISDSIKAMKNFDVCTVAINATDTVICSDNGSKATDFPIRSTMYQEQTPQTFRIGAFERVYNSVSADEQKNTTDACKLFYLCGYDIGIVKGDVSNIKLTYSFDYQVAKIIMEQKI